MPVSSSWSSGRASKSSPSPNAARDPGRALGLLRAAYTSLTRSPGDPLLDFGSLPRLRLRKKAALAVLWPFLRLALELDAASAGMRRDRVALIARSAAAHGQPLATPRSK